MTAPTRTRAKSAAPPAEPRTGRRDERRNGARQERDRTRGGAGTRSAAAERAYARRAQRADQVRRGTAGADAGSGEARAHQRAGWFRLRLPRSRASFVLLIMAMLAGGVAVTLWLSTQAIAGSYKLEKLHEQNGALTERVDKLERVVTKRESATWMAKHARQLGMVPGETPAKLVVHRDGSVTMVGKPQKVTAPTPPPAPQQKPTPPPEEPQAPADDAAPGGSADEGHQPPDGAPEQPAPEGEPPAQGTQAAGEGA